MALEGPEHGVSPEKWLLDRLEQQRSIFRARNEQWREDRNMVLQRRRTQVSTDFPVVESAEPRHQIRAAMDIMTLREPRFTVAIGDQDAAEQDKMNKAERFALGLYREVLRRYRGKGNRPWIRDLAWYTLSGGVALRARVSKGEDDTTHFNLDLLDPMEIYPEFTDEGMVFAPREYYDYAESVNERARLNGWNTSVTLPYGSRERVLVRDFYWLQSDKKKPAAWNAVMVGDHFLKEPTKETQWGQKLPLLVIPASGHPFHDYPNADWEGNYDWVVSGWEGLIASNRRTYKEFDSLLESQALILKRHAEGKTILKLKGGKARWSNEQFSRARALVLDLNESAEPLAPPSSPREREELLNYYIGSIQRGGISFLAFGQLGLEVSGVTVESLINATQGVLAPYVETIQYAAAEGIMMLFDQYRRGRFPAISLAARKEKVAVGERWFIEDFAADDFPKTALVQMSLQLAMPDTKLARIQAARAAVGDQRPLMGMQTVHEEFLEDLVTDSAIEQKRIWEDQAALSPEGDALGVLRGLREMRDKAALRQDAELASWAQAMIDGRLATMQQALAGMQQRVAGIDAQRQAQAGAAQVQREPSPQALQPEASGVRPEAVDADRSAGNTAVANLLARRSRSVNGT